MSFQLSYGAKLNFLTHCFLRKELSSSLFSFFLFLLSSCKESGGKSGGHKAAPADPGEAR